MSGQENLEIYYPEDQPGGRGNFEVAAGLKSLEARLASLTPSPDRLDRDRLMFLAGQASLAEEKVERATILGVSLENRAWPVAFAAMSAVAATLLVMLITTPVRVVSPVSSIAVADRNEKVPTGFDRRSGDSMLSTLDAQVADIDELLAGGESRSDIVSSATDQVEIRTGPILTPARWSKVLDEAKHLDMSPTGASTLRQAQGINS